MKKEDVKIGMKVVPFQKSLGRATFESSIRKLLGGTEQTFLYVNEPLNNGGNGWKLNSKLNSVVGDYYASEDFEPYIEPNKVEEIHLEHFGDKYEDIGKETPMEDCNGTVLKVGDVVNIKSDKYLIDATSIVCTKKGQIMGIWSTDQKHLHREFIITLVKSYKDLKVGEEYSDVCVCRNEIEAQPKPTGKLVYINGIGEIIGYYGNIGRQTPTVDIEGTILCVGDIVTIDSIFEKGQLSIVAENEGDIMGFFSIPQEELLKRNLKKVKSYMFLKDQEVYREHVKVVFDKPIGNEKKEKKAEEPKQRVKTVKYICEGGKVTAILEDGSQGIARLSPEDTYNEGVGFHIAYDRACGKTFIETELLKTFTDAELLDELKRRLEVK